ncbi:MAG: hypothetical protein Q9183_007366, partial [Haloplaca sp. 2 TL-2023]
MSIAVSPTPSHATSISHQQQEHASDSQSRARMQPTIKDKPVSENLNQDSVGQFPFLNGYSHVIYGFRIPTDTSRDAVVDALRNALNTITKEIPWLAWQVSQVDGVYQPAPWPADGSPNEILRIKECDDLVPAMAQIMRASAPVSMLDGNILTPWPSLPASHGLEPPLPVL